MMNIYVAYGIIVVVVASILAIAARVAIKRGYAFGGVVAQKYTQPTQCTCAGGLTDPFCVEHKA
jgi:hypothetical protein